MKTELYIEGKVVDITNDLPALLTFAIDDVANFASRNTSFSKTIVLPGTARNNKLFGHIYEIGSGNLYDATQPNINANFNAAKSASALMFQENIQAFKGIVRLLKIVKFNGSIEYEVAFFGELGSFITKMGNKKLEDLDFSAYDTLYTVANIEASWDNPSGSGVTFPLIDYGTYSVLKHDWKYGTFRPALYAKEYLEKIKEDAGFTWDFPLISTSRFEGLVVPQNMKQLVKNVSNQLDVSYSGTTTLTQADGYFGLPLSFGLNTTLGDFTTDFFNIDYTYTGSASLTTTLYIHIVGTFTKSNVSSFSVGFVQNGLFVAATIPGIIGSGLTSGSFDLIATADVIINTGDVISVSLNPPPSGTYSIVLTTERYYISNGAVSAVPVSLGETIVINDAIPKNILQKDFFSSIVKLWNLYVVEDRDVSNKLIITPYIDFFDTDPSNADDWTDKIAWDKSVEITPMGELNARIFRFTYKKDQDYYNNLYTTRYNENYGDYIYNSNFEFADDEKKLEVVFSGTPLVGWTGEDKIYSTIFKQSGTTEENVDSNIRLLQTKKVTGVSSWDILDDDGSTVLGSFDKYLYCGHLNDPDAPSDDLNFGAAKELFITLVSGNLSNNQFSLYHSAYISEITDKDSKIMRCSCYLTPLDIYNLDFSKLKYINGNLFVLNKVEDYELMHPELCKVEFLKRINTVF